MTQPQLQENKLARRNMLCLLPDYCIPVVVRLPHPCGGYYTPEIRCYSPSGFVGYYAGEGGS